MTLISSNFHSTPSLGRGQMMQCGEIFSSKIQMVDTKKKQSQKTKQPATPSRGKALPPPARPHSPLVPSPIVDVLRADHVQRGNNYPHESDPSPQDLVPCARYQKHLRSRAATIARRTAADGERAVLRLLIKSWTIADFPSLTFNKFNAQMHRMHAKCTADRSTARFGLL